MFLNLWISAISVHFHFLFMFNAFLSIPCYVSLQMEKHPERQWNIARSFALCMKIKILVKHLHTLWSVCHFLQRMYSVRTLSSSLVKCKTKTGNSTLWICECVSWVTVPFLKVMWSSEWVSARKSFFFVLYASMWKWIQVLEFKQYFFHFSVHVKMFYIVESLYIL